jgi:hypothetical protein
MVLDLDDIDALHSVLTQHRFENPTQRPDRVDAWKRRQRHDVAIPA